MRALNLISLLIAAIYVLAIGLALSYAEKKSIDNVLEISVAKYTTTC